MMSLLSRGKIASFQAIGKQKKIFNSNKINELIFNIQKFINFVRGQYDTFYPTFDLFFVLSSYNSMLDTKREVWIRIL